MNQEYEMLNNRLYFKDKDVVSTEFNTCSSENLEQNSRTENKIKTSNGIESTDKLWFISPSNVDVFQQYTNLNEINNTSVKKQVESFLNRFQSILSYNKGYLTDLGKLPPLKIVPNVHDESVLVEWIFKNFRIGFSFEKNESDSSWYIVAQNEINTSNSFGKINNEKIDGLLNSFLIFVIGNV
ncbi:MAG: hypothetical protein ABR980_09410 [Ignavibacteriaceae bacterium]|jgi:hypothetical protein